MGSLALYSLTRTPPSAFTSFSQAFMNSTIPGPQSEEKRPVTATVPPILIRSGRWAPAGGASESPTASASSSPERRRAWLIPVLLWCPTLEADRPVRRHEARPQEEQGQRHHPERQRELQAA